MNEEPRVILLVESDPPLASLIASYLLHDGYEILHAESLESVGCAMHRRPELLLLDLDSVESGEATLGDLGALPVLLLASDRSSLSRMARGGVLHRSVVLYKPFAMHELRQQVRGALPLQETR
jgi:DNA-binding response OmpR family regulator